MACRYLWFAIESVVSISDQTVRGNEIVFKEQLGQIVTKTLEKGILIAINPQLFRWFQVYEIHYIHKINLMLFIKSYEPDNACLILEREWKHPLKVKKT